MALTHIHSALLSLSGKTSGTFLLLFYIASSLLPSSQSPHPSPCILSSSGHGGCGVRLCRVECLCVDQEEVTV